MDGLFPLGFYIGNGFAGPIKKELGLEYNFILGMLFAVIAAAYAFFFVKESHGARTPETGNSNGKMGGHHNRSLLALHKW